MTDPRPSIAELQRATPAEAPWQNGATMAILLAAPVLLEIAAAALALKQAGLEGDEVIRMMGIASCSDDYSAACTLAPRVEERRRAALLALDVALEKVRP